jgi:hypothetical protein
MGDYVESDGYEEATHCVDCGEKLNAEARACGRDMCFECYCIHQSGEVTQ